jgi:hypothetical protein
MTEKQMEQLEKFADTLSQEVLNDVAIELIGEIAYGLAVLIFAETTEEVYDDLKKDGLEAVIAAVKEKGPKVKEVKEIISGFLSDEEIETFAEDLVESELFQPEYPAELLNKVNELEIDLNEFHIYNIVTSGEQLQELYNQLDMNEWRDEAIKQVVETWE